MFGFVRLWVGIFVRLFGCRRCLLIENLALRQQLAVFKRQNSRPRLAAADKLFWVLLRRFWSPWKNALMVVSPHTVVRWHRTGFRMYWRLISGVRKPIGRRPVTKEIRDLIFKMATENPSWRAPRTHGELVMLGFEVSERSVSRWMGHAPQTPQSGQRWVGSCRRELLDYVIPINEKHLKRLLSAYITYYHQDRTHCGLEKQTPEKRMGCAGEGKVIAWPRVGGLHHRYERAA